MHSSERGVLDNTFITEGPVVKAILVFFFPILLGSFFQQLYNTVDALVVGRYLGKEALAAVGGGTSTFVNLLVGLFIGLSNGASVLVSQYYGARNKERFYESIRTSILIAVLGGVFVALVGFFGSDRAMGIMRTPPDVHTLSVVYLRVYFLGMPASLLYNMISSVIRAAGDSKTPLYVLIATCLANIGLDVLFVLVFRMGVAGVAWATVLCEVLSAFALLLVLKRKFPDFTFNLTLYFDGDILRRMLSLGIPAGLQSSMYNVSNIIIQAGINTLGTVVVAANAAYGKADSFFWMCINSMGVAITVFAGQNYGANKRERISRGTVCGLFLGACISILFSVCYLVFGRSILGLFTTDAEVIDVGMVIMHVIAPTFVTFVSIEVLSAVIRGCGQTFYPTLIMFFGVCVIRVVWIFTVFPQNRTIEALMVLYPITWVFTSAVFWMYYIFGNWYKPQDMGA